MFRSLRLPAWTLVAAAGILVQSPVAHAKELRPGVWTTFQHDVRRSGRVEGKGSITTAPTVAWKVPVGGALRSDTYTTEFTAAPLEGDGKVALITIAAGRVRALRADGSEIWKTPIGTWRSILGVWNVDGKGAPEVFVDLNSSVEVLDGGTGEVVRSLPSGQQLQAEFVPLDTSGAGVVAFQASRGSFTGYDFRGGIASAPVLWTGTGFAQTTMLVGDVDGDGKQEIVRSVETGFEVVNPLTGKATCAAPNIGPRAYYYGYFLANVDGKPGDEIVAFDDSYIYSPSTGVYVLGVQTAQLKVLWSETDAATVTREKDHFSIARSVADLDGDGKAELVYSRWDGAKWATRIVDAQSGTLLHTLDGVGIEALADTDGDGKTEILVRDISSAERFPAHSTVKAYDYDSRTAGPVAKSWSLERARVASVSYYVNRGVAAWMPIRVVADFDTSAAGVEVAVEQQDAVATNPARLLLVKGNGTVSAERVWDPGTMGEVLWYGDKLSSVSSAADLATFSNDGWLRSLKRDLSVTGSQRTGSYAGYSLVLPLTAEKSVIANLTSQRELRLYDGTRLQPGGEPVVSWRVRDVTSSLAAASVSFPFDPVVYLETSGAPVLVNLESADGITTIVARESVTGAEKWRTSLPAGKGVTTPGGYAVDVNRDGIDDLAAVVTSTAGQSLTVYDGLDGKVLRDASLVALFPGTDQLFTGALADIDGDGALDLIASIHSVGTVAIKISAEPMTALWSTPKQFNSWNGLIGVAELDGDPDVDLFRVNGWTSQGHYMRLDTKGVIDAHVDPGVPVEPDQDRNAAALVRRDATTFDIVTTGMRDAGEGRVRRLAGDTLNTVWTKYAIGGKLTDLPPSERTALSTPIVADIDGDWSDDIVFGGTDGWLYALRAADGSALMAMQLNAPIDRVVAANLDGDPELELLVTLADGNLVAIDGAGKYTAVTEVPDAGVDAAPDADVDAGSDGGIGANPEVEGGGCNCGTTGRAAAGFGTFALAGALALALARRSRRH